MAGERGATSKTDQGHLRRQEIVAGRGAEPGGTAIGLHRRCAALGAVPVAEFFQVGPCR